ncbi:MAG: hypothetical protein AAB225_12605 [Acidobacteriota bacterium]
MDLLEAAPRNPAGIRVADQAWIATALLHREHPERQDFSIEEITDRARKETWSTEVSPGVKNHISYHAVANKEPNPSHHRMLYATGRGIRRLYRPGDPAHPLRKGKIIPRRDQIPPRYHFLLDWYENEFAMAASDQRTSPDPILGLLGLGSEIWAGESPDEYVRRLREGWE